MLNLQLATASVAIGVDMAQLSAGIARARSMLGALGAGSGLSGSVASGIASGMAAGVARAGGQARTALGSFISQAAATGMAQGIARGAAQAGRGMGGAAGSAGMGLMQGLGVAGFALNPTMMAGQMIGSGLTEAVGSAMALQSTFIDLQRVSGQSAANVDAFKDAVFDIATTQPGVSVADLTQIAGTGAQAGITDKEGMAGLETFTRGMAKVRGAVTGIGTEQLANDMVQMLNLFHMGTGYVESFGSVLARMANISTATASDILDISKNLSGTFSSLQLTIPEAMAFSSVLADVGLTNRQGANSFSVILRMIASQSGEMAKAIGMPVEQFQEAIRTNALGAMKLLIDKFKEINASDPIKAQEWIAGLGLEGIRTAGAFQQIATMIDQVAERTAMAVEEETTLESLTAANALNAQKAEGQIQLLKNAFAELSAEIGGPLVSALNEAAVTATAFIKGLTNQGGGTKPLSMGEGLAFVGETMVDAVGGAIPEAPGFRASINDKRQRIEGSMAAGAGDALSTVAISVEDQIKGLQAAIRKAPPQLRPGMEAGLARLMGSAATAIAQDATAHLGAIPTGEPGGPSSMDVGFSLANARAEDLKAEGRIERFEKSRVAEMLLDFNEPIFVDDEGKPLEGKGLASAKKKDVKSLMDEARNELAGAMMMNAEGAFVSDAERKWAGKGQEPEFQSQRFGDASEYAGQAIQKALSGKDENVEQARIMNGKMDTLIEVTRGRGGDKGGVVMRKE